MTTFRERAERAGRDWYETRPRDEDVSPRNAFLAGVRFALTELRREAASDAEGHDSTSAARCGHMMVARIDALLAELQPENET